MRLSFGIAALIALHAAAARAQIPPELIDHPPAQLVGNAFATDYGRKVVAEFGKILRVSADPECLRSKGVDPAAMDERANDILVRSGTKMFEIYIALVDTTKFEAAFAARAGPNAKAEYARLRADPEVSRLDALSQPATAVTIVLQVSETVTRHALLARIKLKGGFSPLSTGNARLLEEQERITDRYEEEVERVLKTSKSPQITRLLEIQEAFAKAWVEATSENELLKLGPRQLTPGLDRDLAALCVPAGR